MSSIRSRDNSPERHEMQERNARRRINSAPAIMHANDYQHPVPQQPHQPPYINISGDPSDFEVALAKYNMLSYWQRRLDALREHEENNISQNAGASLEPLMTAYEKSINQLQDEYIEKIKYMLPFKMTDNIAEVLETRKRSFPEACNDEALIKIERNALDNIHFMTDSSIDDDNIEHDMLSYIHDHEDMFRVEFKDKPTLEKLQEYVGRSNHISHKIMHDNFYDQDKNELVPVKLNDHFFKIIEKLLLPVIGTEFNERDAIVSLKSFADVVNSLVDDNDAYGVQTFDLQNRLSGTYSLLTSYQRPLSDDQTEQAKSAAEKFLTNMAQITAGMHQELLRSDNAMTDKEKIDYFLNKTLECAKQAHLLSLRT